MKLVRGHEGEGEIHEFNRPSGLCCDDKGQVVIADSKNQRVLIYNTDFEFQWMVSHTGIFAHFSTLKLVLIEIKMINTIPIVIDFHTERTR